MSNIYSAYKLPGKYRNDLLKRRNSIVRSHDNATVPATLTEHMEVEVAQDKIYFVCTSWWFLPAHAALSMR